MNFLNKARKKAEDALKEIQAQAQAQTQSFGQPHQQSASNQVPHPNPQQYQQESPPPLQTVQQQQYFPPPPPAQGSRSSYHQPPYPPQPSPHYFPPPPQPHGNYVPPPNQQQPGLPQPGDQFSPPPQSHGDHPPIPPPLAHPNPASSQTGSEKCLARESVFPSQMRFYCFAPSLGIPGETFTMCINCYQTNVAPYSLASNFVEYRSTSDNLRFTCDFGLPRIRAAWYSQCIPQNTIQPLVEFTDLVKTLVPCNGSTISSPGPFWMTKNGAVPELAVCQTCFEVLLRYTAFESHFENKTFTETRDWACDLALPFFRRGLITELDKPSPDFQDIVSEYNTRFAITPCSGVGKAISTMNNDQSQSLVLTAVDGTGNLCFACYSDYLANTSLEAAFVPVALTEEQKTTVICDLATPYSKSAMEVAILQHDLQSWRSAVGIAGKVGSCLGRKGVSEEDWEKKVSEFGSLAQWYHINNYPTIEICPSCYWLSVKLLKTESAFSPITRPLRAGIVRMCFLAISDAPPDAETDSPANFENSMTWRGRRLRTAIGVASETKNFSALFSEASSISKEPPVCGGNERGFKRPSGRKWYGRLSQNTASNDDCTIVMCEECHSRTVKGTPLDSYFSVDLTDAAYENEGQTGFVCQPYSNRARTELHDAAQRGDLASFARYWNLREALRKKKDQWGPILAQQTLKMQMQNHQQGLNLLLKTNAQANALMKIGGAGIVEAAMSDPGVRYGNSQIGYDSYTRGRAEAQQEFADAQNMDIGTGTGMSTVMESQRLILLAAQDEAAFKKYE